MVLIWHLRTFFGLGAVFSALSELWFYPISDVSGLALLVVFYAVAAHAAVLGLHALGAGGALGFYLAAVVLGLLVEGVPVFELYTALPFTFVWTSMAWHGVVSGLIGVWLYRHCAARGWGWFLAINAAFGTSLGLWAAYFWSQEPEGLRYAEQLPWAFGLFVLGQLLLPATPPPAPRRAFVMWSMSALVVFAYAVAPMWVLFPVSLVLPLAIGVTLYAARGAQTCDPLWSDVPARRAVMMLILPVCAVLAFDIVEGQRWVVEMNAYAILILGPLSVVLFVMCLVRAMKKGRHESALASPSR